MPAQLLKLTRQVHLYLGVFIAPMLLFFAFTGALQTFSLHETTRGSDYKPPQWAVTLAQLHKKQNIAPSPKRTVAPPEAKAAKPAKSPDATASGTAVPGATAPAPPPPTAPKPKSHLPEKIFFLLVSVGLFTSTLTGIYMAYKYNRNKWIVTGLLLAGVILPIALLPF